MEKITIPVVALQDFLGLEALISLSRENIEQVVDHCKDKLSGRTQEVLLSLIKQNHEDILASKTDLLQLRFFNTAVTLYAAASFAKTPADFSVGEPPRCHGVLERPIGRYTHYHTSLWRDNSLWTSHLTQAAPLSAFITPASKRPNPRRRRFRRSRSRTYFPSLQRSPRR